MPWHNSSILQHRTLSGCQQREQQTLSSQKYLFLPHLVLSLSKNGNKKKTFFPQKFNRNLSEKCHAVNGSCSRFFHFFSFCSFINDKCPRYILNTINGIREFRYRPHSSHIRWHKCELVVSLRQKHTSHLPMCFWLGLWTFLATFGFRMSMSI